VNFGILVKATVMTDQSILHLSNTKYSQARSGVNFLKKAEGEDGADSSYVSNIEQTQLAALFNNDFKPQHEKIDTGFGNALDTINAHVRLASAHLDACNSLALEIWGTADEESAEEEEEENEKSSNLTDKHLTIHFAYALRNLADMLQTKHSKALMHFLRQRHPNSTDHVQETIAHWLNKPLNQQSRPNANTAEVVGSNNGAHGTILSTAQKT